MKVSFPIKNICCKIKDTKYFWSLFEMFTRGENMYYIAICDDNADFLEAMEKTIKTNQEYEADMICQKFWLIITLCEEKNNLKPYIY